MTRLVDALTDKKIALGQNITGSRWTIGAHLDLPDTRLFPVGHVSSPQKDQLVEANIYLLASGQRVSNPRSGKNFTDMSFSATHDFLRIVPIDDDRLLNERSETVQLGLAVHQIESAANKMLAEKFTRVLAYYEPLNRGTDRLSLRALSLYEQSRPEDRKQPSIFRVVEYPNLNELHLGGEVGLPHHHVARRTDDRAEVAQIGLDVRPESAVSYNYPVVRLSIAAELPVEDIVKAIALRKGPNVYDLIGGPTINFVYTAETGPLLDTPTRYMSLTG